MEPSLAISGLRFGWRDAEAPLLAIDALTIARGEKVLLRGPSGSGKSTLLNLIGGVLVPDAGRICVLGTDITRLGATRRDRFRADNIGFVFQMFNLLPYLSVLDNVLLPCRFSRRRRAGEDAARALLTGLQIPDSLCHARVSRLSVGQQQRVAAARALIGAPALVIADEPTSALDTGNRNHFMNLLMDQCARHGSTLLIVSHDATLPGDFDRRIDLSALNRC